MDVRRFIGTVCAIAVAGHRIVGIGPRRRLSLLPFVAVVYGVCAVALFVVTLVAVLILATLPRR